ncbi:MAG: glycosyltransferase family 2 protein [Candidatus Eremiobacteraeota bacterium]|nr:glycosyltransferase family 2 protein [Candidatus Eremiobacteraeota bacterium]
MPDAFRTAAGVAVVPCYNEGRNPIELTAALSAVPDVTVVFVDDASETESRDALDSLSQTNSRVRIVRNPARIGKVASLLNVLRSLDPAVQRVLLLDCDVVVTPATVRTVLDEVARADLVLANSVALPGARTLWERGAIFSARRHERLRRNAIARYPALCSNGRLLAMRRRLVDAVVRSDVPRHTEDAHFMLVCLAQGYAYSYCDGAVLHYRAPDSLDDYLRQSNRFSEGRSLLQARWPAEVLARYYDPRPVDLLRTFAAQAAVDPIGAGVFLLMLAAKSVQGRAGRSQTGAWAVAASTKSLR